MTTSWVLKITGSRIKEIAKAGLGLVLSGSPRTISEAKYLFPIMKKFYGRENMLFFILKVSSENSIKRNSGRLVCSVCGSPILRVKSNKNFTTYSPCPFCGGKLVKRTLDRPSVIKDRLAEFNLKTKPIFSIVKKEGYNVKEIKGEALPFKVFNSIKKEIIKI
jgi:adenylate kinase family enzyme